MCPCIDSILSQTFSNFELLCVYDCSTDDTWELLCHYQRKDSRIVLVSGNNQGPGGARNLGISLAKGEYWAFWDSDDIFDRYALEKMFLSAKNTDAEVIVCCSSYLSKEKIVGKISEAVQLERLPRKEVFSASDCSGFLFEAFIGWAWDKLFRASFCRELGLQFGDNYILEDGAFVFSALVNASRITLVQEQLVFHRIHMGSLEASGAQFNQHWRDVFINAAAIQKNIKKNPRQDLQLRRSFCRWLLNFCLWVLRKTSGDAFDAMCFRMPQEIQGVFGFSILELREFCYREDYHAYMRFACPTAETHYTHLKKAAVWKIRKLEKGARYFLTGRGSEIMQRLHTINRQRSS